MKGPAVHPSIYLMKGRVKVKKSKASGINMDELNDMFNQMLGTSNINLEFAWPRYQKIRNMTQELVGYLGEIATHKLVRVYFPAEGQDLEDFCAAASKNVAEMMSITIDPAEITPETHEAFTSSYNMLVSSRLMIEISNTCKQLHVYSKYLTASPPTARFLETIPGLEWYPISVSRLNFKALFSAPGVAEITTGWLLETLANIYETAKDICKELQTPNINIDKFAEIIISSLEQIQKEPKLSRCSGAFAKIRESIDLLKGNFSTYYADFIDSSASGKGNGFIIMEHFIADVSNNTKGGIKLKREFAQILNFFYELMEKKRATSGGSPAVSEMMSKFGNIFETFKLEPEELHIDTISGESQDESANPQDTAEPSHACCGADHPATHHKHTRANNSTNHNHNHNSDSDPNMASRIRAATMSVDELAAEIDAVAHTKGVNNTKGKTKNTSTARGKK